MAAVSGKLLPHKFADSPKADIANVTSPTYNQSMRCIMPSDQEESSPCCHMGPIHALFVCIIHIISLSYQDYTPCFKIGNCIWVCIHCRKLPNQHIHHRGSVRIQTKSIRDSIINLQQVLSHAVNFSNLPIWKGLADVLQPCSKQFRLELSTQSIDNCSND
jgi:hypothetical protein